MIDIQRVNHVGIRVADLATSRRFYEKLGFEFVVGPVGPEPVAIMTHPGGVVLNFILNVSADAPTSNVLMDSDVKLPGYTHVALEVSDLDAAIASATAASSCGPSAPRADMSSAHAHATAHTIQRSVASSPSSSRHARCMPAPHLLGLG